MRNWTSEVNSRIKLLLKNVFFKKQRMIDVSYLAPYVNMHLCISMYINR